MGRVARTTKDTAPRDELRLRELDRRAQGSTGTGSGTGRPAASLYQTSPQTIPNGAFTPIRWDTAIVDTHGGWAPDNPTRYYVRLDGLYVVAHVVIPFGTTGKKATGLRRNGINVRASGGIIPAGGVSDSLVTGPMKVVACTTGDYLDVTLYQDTGAAQNTYADPVPDTATGSGLDLFWIGPLTG